MERLTDLDKLALFRLDLPFGLFVVLLLSLKTLQVLLVLVLLSLEPALGVTVLHTGFVDELIAAS